jgi:hypothetical protein
MLRVDARRRVDLKRVIIVCGIFEKTVKGVEHLMRQEEEEFSTIEYIKSKSMLAWTENTNLERPP